ncbi:ABC transporter ATP-binding protein [Roseivirga sp. E12]|uniref:ABC transporter ATP-binding protein n=1 Tax=Roseivirga sp. E12 TaxID=2819237 RepID=UPI001ABD06DA|nr:ABC transporter ATP-binding protein [Roseivirga sp. E12]MBO3700741.1 ABC transporter ATP-binding protein [Roseivirga sp. E12]
MLNIQNFKKAYGSQLILEIPSLSFSEGIHWVKGKNGSGKSTLFNCLAGISPFEGKVELNGYSLSKQPVSYKRLLNYSQSEPTFPEFLTGNDLISYFGQLKGATPAQVTELSQQLSIESFSNQPVGNYSSGMLKKLSLVIAFLGNASWIILDEPLITLDKEAQEALLNLIADKSKKEVSFILATHQDFENQLIEADHTYEVKDQGIIRDL